jgi:hypothetical protein
MGGGGALYRPAAMLSFVLGRSWWWRAPSGGPLCVGFLVPGVTRTGRNRIFYSAKKRGAFHLSPERSDRRGMPKKTELLLTHQHVTKKKWVLVRKPCPARRSLHDYSGM